MKRRSLSLLSTSLLALFAIACEDMPPGYVPPTINPARNPIMTFFVTSEKHLTGNLGGLASADRTCQTLGEMGGGVGKTWKAYLSAERGPDGGPVHARDRIGRGPWFNANGLRVAADVASLHDPAVRKGDPIVFIDEQARKINGQWDTMLMPNEHDVLTGSNPDGTVFVGGTCADWTSESPDLRATVGHSDGLGPMMNPEPPFSSWNSSHQQPATNAMRMAGCANTAPGGGAGRFYCFAVTN